MHQETISRCFETGENTQMSDFTSIEKQECFYIKFEEDWRISEAQ